MSEEVTGKIEIQEQELQTYKENITDFPSLKEALEKESIDDITSLLKTAFVGVMILDGSDMHIEAGEEGAALRARIDGLLHDIAGFDRKTYEKILSRIKLLSGIKINIEKKPQDGRFSIILGEENEIEIRTSTLPTQYGETIVLRILNPKKLINLEDLGLREDLAKVFNEQAEKPNGMIIVTGPTGSGKTTTLYAFLKKMQNPEIKIITIEDPIEYHLDGISQTQVAPSKGYDFASGLRSIVRQDPDAILVGEIRDLETASIAIQAALTGHLVLSTLHTNDAAGAIARLQALGEKAVNIAPAINIVIAQRLVRKVCPKCKELVDIPSETMAKIKEELKNVPTEIIPESNQMAVAKGCKYCNNTGYKGRVGIFETFIVDDEMENFIISSPSSADLQKKAIEKGMILMRQDGLIKVLKQETTLEEIKRVVGE